MRVRVLVAGGGIAGLVAVADLARNGLTTVLLEATPRLGGQAQTRSAAARLRAAPNTCLALEYSHNGVRAGYAAGMMTVMASDLLGANDEMAASA
ncbi:MAG TPA: NAD(P)-binding protein [Caulobacteraceae bacterium]|jgi:heterodisulfide reductase subunit A-like polyferredoxin